MTFSLKDFTSSIKFGEEQSTENISVFPLFSESIKCPNYLTLKDALQKKVIKITEIDKSGSVPNLRVTNNANYAVFLLDGEELRGAKQNRILNTSILLKKKSETIIPVSCTEKSRWAYNTKHFEDSDVMASGKIRMFKTASVTESLRDTANFCSAQGEIWNAVDDLASKTNVKSSTMRDIFESKKTELDELLKSFVLLKDQKGLLVIENGEILGLDIIFNEKLYKNYHRKFLHSYIIDANLRKSKNKLKTPKSMAKSFLKAINECESEKFKSIGLGNDFRLRKKNIVGSALAYRKRAIHMAFFRKEESMKEFEDLEITTLKKRRTFRE